MPPRRSSISNSFSQPLSRNRSLSIRSNRSHKNSDSITSPTSGGRHRFIPSLRGSNPELSRRLAKLIKSENHVISAYESAGREETNIAGQLSEWGESTGDDALSEISDKLGVLLAEIAEQEDSYAQGLEDSRGVLKQIRNTESSVQPSRDHKAKIQDEIQKLKYKEPTNPKIVQLEQELVRAEAQSLVAEAQLTNITRQKLRQAYDIHLRALLERSTKQALLAAHARHVLALLDDTPIVPGESRPAFTQENELRQILSEAEEELRAWQPTWEDLPESRAEGRLTAAGVPSPESGNGNQTLEREKREQQEILASAGTVEGEGLDAGGQAAPSSTVANSGV